MSKTDALRAIKDARRAAASTPSDRPARPPVAPRTPAAAPQHPVPEPDPATDGLCGHRSMNGRSCTRPSGHVEKNHRYS